MDYSLIYKIYIFCVSIILQGLGCLLEKLNFNGCTCRFFVICCCLMSRDAGGNGGDPLAGSRPFKSRNALDRRMQQPSRYLSAPPTYMAAGPTSDGESLPPFLKGGREGAW